MTYGAAITEATQTGRSGATVGSARPSKRSGLTLGGCIACITAVSLGASTSDAARIPIGGFMMHPCLIPVGLAAPFLIIGRLGRFPWQVLAALLLFVFFFALSCVGASSAGDIVKVASSVLLIVALALSVRTPSDFVAATVGMAIPIAILAIGGLVGVTNYASGVEAIEGNKNTYSFYALPSLLLSGHVILTRHMARFPVKCVLAFCITVTAAAVLLSANRSGWLGCAVIGVMLFKKNWFRGGLFVAFMAAIVGYYIVEFASTKVYTMKAERMAQGKEADAKRIELFRHCWDIALDYPVTGISPQHLPVELARRLEGHVRFAAVAPHNVIGYVLGGCGFVCFFAFLAIGYTLWTIQPTLPPGRYDPVAWADSRRLVRMMAGLWILRGLFSEEILFHPAFSIGIGLAVGICIIVGATPRTGDLAHAA